MFRKSWAWHGIAMSLDAGLLRSHHRLMIVAFRWRHGNVWKCDTHRLSTNGNPSGSFKIMGRICPKENSVCSKFQIPINLIPKLVLEINSDPPCCTSQWLPCSEALVVLAMSSIDCSWRKRRVVSSRQLMHPTKPKKILELTNIYIYIKSHPIPSWHQPHRVYHQTTPRL